MRVFVIWDLASPAVQTLLEALPELLPEHEGQRIEWQIPSATANTAGRQLARDVIASGIQAADHVIALLDRPSASVGWQVGLALGWRRSLQLSFIGAALPTWTQVGALKGLFAHHLSDVTGVRLLLERQPWEMPPIPAISPVPGAGQPQLVLCPTGPIGSTLREVALQAPGGLAALPDDGWGLYELPQLLGGPARVIWVLASDVREGADNASNGVVAGFAEASGLNVAVLRAEDLPPVVDVQPRELRFRGLGEFKQRLGQLTAGAALQLRSLPSSASAGASGASAAVRLPTTTESPAKRRLVIVPILLLAGLAAAGGVGWRLSQRSPSPAPTPLPSTAAPVTAAPPPAAPVATAPAAAASPTDKEKRHPGKPGRGARPRGPQLDPNDAMAFMTNTSMLDARSDPNILEPPTEPAAKPPPRAGSCKLSEERLGQLAADIQAERFSAIQLQMAEEAVKKHCMTVAQLAWLLEIFKRPDNKLSVIHAAAAQVRDPENAEELLSHFPAGYERSQVMSLFQR